MKLHTSQASMRSYLKSIGWIAAVSLTSCTGQIPGSFRLTQQAQNFSANLSINTKIDLLWVVDNSSSMEAEQDKLRQGFTGFANKYLQPTWDIQVAVITTDTYLANPAYMNFLQNTIAGTGGWQSPQVYSESAFWKNPTSYPSLVDTSTWEFTSDISNNVLVPAWGETYALLMPGIHDGPIAGFCFEGMPYSMISGTSCGIRDNYNNYNGTSHCLNPVGTETAQTMCQNTIENDTVHSGKAIIKTMPPSPLTGSALTAWTNQLVADFQVNASTGITGMGSERGMQSVLQMMSDNEYSGSPTSFFRPGALRGIIFVSDEDDQSMTVASGSQVSPMDNYMCDQAALLTQNNASLITGSGGYCCSGAGCEHGANGISCPHETIDGTDYVITLCPDPTKLMSVSSVKSQIDTFFSNLDGTTGNPNYFIATITPYSMSSILALKKQHDDDDQAAAAVTGAPYVQMFTVDRGQRYIDLANLVGNNSISLDISATDYSPLLDQIGQAIILQKSTFPLSRTPTSQEDMVLTLIHQNGSSTVVPTTDYLISGLNVIITNQSLVLSFAATDSLSVVYQPKYLNH